MLFKPLAEGTQLPQPSKPRPQRCENSVNIPPVDLGKEIVKPKKKKECLTMTLSERNQRREIAN